MEKGDITRLHGFDLIMFFMTSSMACWGKGGVRLSIWCEGGVRVGVVGVRGKVGVTMSC